MKLFFKVLLCFSILRVAPIIVFLIIPLETHAKSNNSSWVQTSFEQSTQPFENTILVNSEISIFNSKKGLVVHSPTEDVYYKNISLQSSVKFAFDSDILALLYEEYKNNHYFLRLMLLDTKTLRNPRFFEVAHSRYPFKLDIIALEDTLFYDSAFIVIYRISNEHDPSLSDLRTLSYQYRNGFPSHTRDQHIATGFITEATLSSYAIVWIQEIENETMTFVSTFHDRDAFILNTSVSYNLGDIETVKSLYSMGAHDLDRFFLVQQVSGPTEILHLKENGENSQIAIPDMSHLQSCMMTFKNHTQWFLINIFKDYQFDQIKSVIYSFDREGITPITHTTHIIPPQYTLS